ncbi:glycoside hydrolase family 108 protein [Dyella tabacisoli]|uniref:N-acetylmuramidase n=1 Tax=Dyella tabacisoli TaxID=2282381 RepID=A0A369URZ1_9GAMM|nr:N-acetylmuramidase [Dyella tabacisoli]RDD83436.1 N-acetylmuramidase [Dyella tabacisoli]
MANFDMFFPTLLKFEGGFVNDPDDPGGATNLGITMETFNRCANSLLKIAPTLDNLRALTPAQAGVIYKAMYWDRIGGDTIALQPLAEIVFDFNVNAGANAGSLLQRVLNQLSDKPPLAVDGGIGPATLARLAELDQTEVYRRYKQGRVDYYNQLVERRPVMGKFLKGWLARVNAFPTL